MRPCCGASETEAFNTSDTSSIAVMLLSHVRKKHVFVVCDQGRLKPACAATEAEA